MAQKKNAHAVAVVGATGVVGREIVSLLDERKFPVSELVLLASDRSAGERIEFRGRNLSVGKLAKDSFSGVDIAFFSAGSDRSRTFAPLAVKAGAVVVDLSGAFRGDRSVPLVVPEVNGSAIGSHQGIIANPGSSAIELAMVLKPLHEAAKVTRVVVTTLASVSGSGKEAMDELAGQTVALLNFKDVEKKVYPHQIAFNCLPHIDGFLDSGQTTEEEAIGVEIVRVLEDPSVRVTATAVRVPVFRGNAASVTVETEKKIGVNDARAALAGASGVIVYDDPSRNLYPLPLDVAGKDEVFVGRIREDGTVPNGLCLWVVADNLRKGAALNAVQIAERLVS